jgi:hypothetical protein
MTQRELNRAIARATGESVEMIDRMGFGPLDELSENELEPLTVDWDAGMDVRLAMRSVLRRRLVEAV